MKKAKLIGLLIALNSCWALAQNHYPFANGTLTVPDLGSRNALECVGCQRTLNDFLRSKFNRPGDFHGPNCYNTALIASGAFRADQIRYVSPEEFEAILALHYSPLVSETPDSLVVFDSKSSRGHAGLYLGDNLVFHKKSFSTNYHYRISTIENVGVVEKNEWVPSPIEGSINQFVWPELGKLPKAFYRFNKRSLSYQSGFAPVLKQLEAQLLVDLGQWAIAKKWGLIGMNLIEDYYQLTRESADSLTKGMLISFKDQLSLYFDEVHYKNSRAYDRTTAEICLPENPEQLKKVYIQLAAQLKRPTSEIETKWEKVLGQDKKRCSVRLLK